jgi:hypothetical protein
MTTVRSSEKSQSEIELLEWYREEMVHNWGEHRRECVCIGAMLRSTMLDATFLEGDDNAKSMLLCELEDYARYEETEASQFDIPATKKFLEKLDKRRVLQLLHDMGKSPISDRNGFDDWKWGQFINALA